MAYLMATEQRAHDVAGGSVSYTSSLGCIKSRATTIGCSLYSPSSGYDSNQLVRYDDLYKSYTPPPTPSATITVSYQGFTISNNWRIYGAPSYTYSGTSYTIVQSGDWPVGSTTNAINLPSGVNSLTIYASTSYSAYWNGSGVGDGFVIQGSSVNSSSAPTYISFVSSGSSSYGSAAGYLTYQRSTSTSSGYIYTYYTAQPFNLFYGMTLIVKSGIGY